MGAFCGNIRLLEQMLGCFGDGEIENLRPFHLNEFRNNFSEEAIKVLYEMRRAQRNDEAPSFNNEENNLRPEEETHDYMLEWLADDAVHICIQQREKEHILKNWMIELIATKTDDDPIPQALIWALFNYIQEENDYNKEMGGKSMPRIGENNPKLKHLFEQLEQSTKRYNIELASEHKLKGNDNFKMRNYQEAVTWYTLGIDVDVVDGELLVQLLTNRAAANFHLGNIESSLADCRSALKIKPDHLKALIRIMQCYRLLKRYDDALSWGRKGLKLLPTEKLLMEEIELTEQEKKC